MEYIVYIIAFMIVFNSVVFIHELGHYLCARYCKIKSTVFSIGMGPEVLGKTDKNGTRWRFSLLPVGGYVMMLGNADASSITNDEISKHSPEYQYTYQSKSGFQKMLVAFGGPFFNYIYAFILFLFISMICGKSEFPPVIDTIVNGSVAERSGLQKGDEIQYMNFKKINSYKDITKVLGERDSNEMPILITRGDKEANLVAKFENKKEKFGIKSSQPVWKKLSFFGSFTNALQECYEATCEMLWAFGKLFTGKKSIEDFGGIIQIASVTGDALNEMKFALFFLVMAKISLSLGFINLLPIPVLDGGTIILSFIEQIIGKPLNEKFLEYISIVFAVLLIALTIFVTYNDIVNIPFIKTIISRF